MNLLQTGSVVRILSLLPKDDSQVKEILDKLYEVVTPDELAEASQSEGLLIFLHVTRGPNDGDKIIKAALWEPAEGYTADEVADAAIRLSKTLQGAPVTFWFEDVGIKATPSDSVQGILAVLKNARESRKRPNQRGEIKAAMPTAVDAGPTG